jgi:hypothetical protein
VERNQGFWLGLIHVDGVSGEAAGESTSVAAPMAAHCPTRRLPLVPSALTTFVAVQ